MINQLSNQNYNYQYAVGQVAPPAQNPVVSQPQIGVTLPATSAIGSNKRSQELGPKECKT
jgi:hypothetical protein